MTEENTTVAKDNNEIDDPMSMVNELKRLTVALKGHSMEIQAILKKERPVESPPKETHGLGTTPSLSDQLSQFHRHAACEYAALVGLMCCFLSTIAYIL